MKHYISPLPELIGSDKIKVFAPFDGTVSEVTESPPGKQVFISSSKDRRWNFIFFHIVPTPDIEQGVEVTAGQLVGYVSPEIRENFDIGLKKFGFGQTFDSPFVHMSESVIKEYQLRGVALENVIISKEERDSNPCPVEGTSNGDARFEGHGNEDLVLLTQQKIGTEQKEIEHREVSLLSPATFYQDGKVVFEHYWPLDPLAQHLKADESEMVVYNDGDTNLQITSTDMKFLLDGKSYSQYSGTWEKFPSRTSWEKLEYINIKPDYYKNEPLILQPGQKAKIHYHYKFDTEFAGKKQVVQIALKYKLNGVENNLDRRLERTRELYYSETNAEEGH